MHTSLLLHKRNNRSLTAPLMKVCSACVSTSKLNIKKHRQERKGMLTTLSSCCISTGEEKQERKTREQRRGRTTVSDIQTHIKRSSCTTASDHSAYFSEQNHRKILSDARERHGEVKEALSGRDRNCSGTNGPVCGKQREDRHLVATAFTAQPSVC